MKPSEMTDDQLCIKVAELLNLCRPLISDQSYERGWRDLDGCVHYWCDERKNPPWPNYPHDLNACHEMEKSLSEDETAPHSKLYYSDRLSAVCKRNGFYWDNMATARQRCEAFVEAMS